MLEKQIRSAYKSPIVSECLCDIEKHVVKEGVSSENSGEISFADEKC